MFWVLQPLGILASRTGRNHRLGWAVGHGLMRLTALVVGAAMKQCSARDPCAGRAWGERPGSAREIWRLSCPAVKEVSRPVSAQARGHESWYQRAHVFGLTFRRIANGDRPGTAGA